MRHVVSTPNAAAAAGPYSMAVEAGGLVFIAGQVGSTPPPARWSGAEFQSRRADASTT